MVWRVHLYSLDRPIALKYFAIKKIFRGKGQACEQDFDLGR